ncbi:copper resistance protein CopC [Mesorhizobium plurifarium]|uniref:copper resistance CopC/CopD family protein n=1 Tax=Sinorhizobium arboris TaxID=76745 RepID=UPI000413D944|nr:copper resistance CopC/CopD family protein [Sinorhizobium arboris]PST22718.1 copper resistance protein CopC [Mesorhizobium plurifarium]
MRAHRPLISPRFSRFARLVALAVLGILAQIGVAWAHASLNASEPGDGAVIDTAPSTYQLTFSEPVSPLSLRLVGPDGSSVPLERFEITDRTVEIVAPANIGRGTHVLSWRVISADGHAVSGSLVFSIGAATSEPPLIGEGTDWAVRAGILGSRVALYVGLFLGVGGAFASSWLLGGSRSGRRAVAAALGVGILGTLSSVGFQGLDALGAPLARICEPLMWSTAMATSHGRTVITASIALAAAGVAALGKRQFARPASLISLILVGAALLLSGHAATAQPQWLVRPALFLHAASIAFWMGALVPLGLALRRGDPAAPTALRRFSATIPYVVIALFAAGVVLTLVQVQEPNALTTTTYGQVLLVKLGLIAGLFLLAVVNRWRLTRPVVAGEVAATSWLVRTIAAETAIVLLVFLVAASWRFTPPPRTLAAAARPASTHIHTDKAMALVEVRPGRPGQGDVSINLSTGELERLYAKEVMLVLSKPDSGIEPFSRPAVRREEAVWRIDQMPIPLAGTWQVRVDILISDFETVRLRGQIRIRPSGQ